MGLVWDAASGLQAVIVADDGKRREFPLRGWHLEHSFKVDPSPERESVSATPPNVERVSETVNLQCAEGGVEVYYVVKDLDVAEGTKRLIVSVVKVAVNPRAS